MWDVAGSPTPARKTVPAHLSDLAGVVQASKAAALTGCRWRSVKTACLKAANGPDPAMTPARLLVQRSGRTRPALELGRRLLPPAKPAES